MNTYSFSTIAKLMRAQFAANTIDDIANNARLAALESPAAYASEYFTTKLNETDKVTGKTTSCAGKYVTRIFQDILDKTGLSVLDYKEKGKYHNLANIRKRLLGVNISYAHRSSKEYTPQEEYRTMIVKYLGVKSWQQLVEDAEDLLAEQEAYLQDIADGTCQPTVKDLVLKPDFIKQRSLLNMRFSDGGTLNLYSLGNCEFRIQKTVDTGLNKGDIVSITDRIIIGSRLAGDVTYSCKKRFSDFWLSEGTVRSFKVIDDYTCLIA